MGAAPAGKSAGPHSVKSVEDIGAARAIGSPAARTETPLHDTALRETLGFRFLKRETWEALRKKGEGWREEILVVVVVAAA